MIVLIGDIHGEFNILAALVSKIPDNVPIIQVGDFGFWNKNKPFYVVPKNPILWIDGNHDEVPICQSCDWPNATFVPRGEVRVIDGSRVLFLGGATSVDRAWRPHNYGTHAWFDQEVITEIDVERAISHAHAVGGIDLMVTHSPPDWMILKHFSKDGLRSFGINPETWRDYSAERVELVWKTLGEPPLFCGHMHESVTDGQCRILAINEVAFWQPKSKEESSDALEMRAG